KELRDRAVHNAQRRIWTEHAYAHRAQPVMVHLEMTYNSPLNASVSAIGSTNRPQHLDAIVGRHAKQSHQERQLVLVTHGFEVPREFRARARDAGIEHLEILKVDEEEQLGTCLNRGISASSGDVVAKMDDDDLYGAHYLEDQLAALR
ncbi:glycosyltransferase, partial [Burkholderia multivorans]